MRTDRLRTVHPLLWAGLGAAALGAVLCVIGWYGVSGERFAERQVPYLASCTLPGAALIVAGAVLVAQARSAAAAARMDALYALLVHEEEPPPAPVQPAAISRELLLVPGGTLYHRADCPLVAGKPEAVPADAHAVADGELGPCPICEPDASGEPGRGAEAGHTAEPGRAVEPGQTAESRRNAEPGRTVQPGQTPEPRRNAEPGRTAEPGGPES
ncbi:hypothetical protein SAMN05421806_103461 [Streptomyces indicus]|uniref:Uncharacterized protein n=1 Tax=Streptomyces indicus TaxID=417292 RepID=A0A1G8XXH9_9ACTN|nr:hypothetical protein SAMN05421806_103461 [Streptomyces indicus]